MNANTSQARENPQTLKTPKALAAVFESDSVIEGLGHQLDAPAE
jgi:hypothetical protein